MCCFTRPVKSVTTTRIFARADDGGRQFLVYSMRLDAEQALAMVLPLPIKPGSGEEAVKFINLKHYPEFFDEMERGFPPWATQSQGYSSDFGPIPASKRLLEVVQVGDFEASFVPTEKDFSRLDERFQLPAGTWEKLPDYRDYGFAVFKLKPGLQQLHPMSFSFPRRDGGSLFFPTVHIHDGSVHAEAEFDHVLYCQPREGEPLKFVNERVWDESRGHAGNFMKPARTQGVVDADQHCYKRPLRGNLPNRDTFVKLEA